VYRLVGAVAPWGAAGRLPAHRLVLIEFPPHTPGSGERYYLQARAMRTSDLPFPGDP
jgi:hypothetical protein